MTETDASHPTVIRGLDTLTLVALIAVPVVLLMLVPEETWQWARPPHYPPWSPAYTSPFSSSYLSILPKMLLTLTIGFVAGVVRVSIRKRWPNLRQRAEQTEGNA